MQLYIRKYASLLWLLAGIRTLIRLSVMTGFKTLSEQQNYLKHNMFSTGPGLSNIQIISQYVQKCIKP